MFYPIMYDVAVEIYLEIGLIGVGQRWQDCLQEKSSNEIGSDGDPPMLKLDL